MRWVSRLTTVAIAALLVGAVAIVVIGEVIQHRGNYPFHTSAAFRDASHLPVGSRVVIAGVRVGEITALTVDGRLARVSIQLRGDVPLYDDAWAEKRAESLFGDGYLEIHPGTEGHRRLADGEPIPRVDEGASTDRTLRAIDQGIPAARQALDRARRFADEARRAIDGPLADQLAEIDRAVKDPDLFAPLDRANDALGQFEASTTEAAEAVAEVRPQVVPALDKFNRRVVDATTQMKDGEGRLKDTLADARTKMDEVDPYIDDAAKLVEELDGSQPPEQQGTAAKLINDPKLGNQIDDAAADGASLTRSLTRLASFVQFGFRYDVLGHDAHFTIGAEIPGTHDGFYYVEAEENEGLAPDVEISDQLVDNHWVRTAKIDEGILLTLQWGHRFDHWSVRFGLRENEFGVGADTGFLGDRLQLKSDIIIPTFQRVPRIRLAAAMKVFEWAYVLGGVDDVLIKGQKLDIAPWPVDDEPNALDKVHYGRDYFVGGYLRFSDNDLDTLLLLYGAAIFAAL